MSARACLTEAPAPASLTGAGNILLAVVAENRERLVEALTDIRMLTANTGPVVTIACTMGFATYWLMPRLEAFYLDQPDVVVNVQTTMHEVPSLGPGIDIALRYGDGHWSDGEVDLLFREVIEPVCSPKLATRIQDDGGSLASAFLIHVDFPDKRWLTWSQYLAQTGQKTAGSAKGIRFSNYVQATQAALSGHGIMLGWRSITGDHVNNKHLVPAGLTPLVPDNAYYSVRSHRSRTSKTVQIVVDWLTNAAAV